MVGPAAPATDGPESHGSRPRARPGLTDWSDVVTLGVRVLTHIIGTLTPRVQTRAPDGARAFASRERKRAPAGPFGTVPDPVTLGRCELSVVGSQWRPRQPRTCRVDPLPGPRPTTTSPHVPS
ncbi:hypothetical protein BN12_2400009 [Nostocoides japonicum T1-X7]|uniref:Uncharacterized protein n=1 Tax=Nostocoides japonicum T1-X7 TaxID=1194083 RepID=A0A077M1C3_9MICO|nr:hypothetical protein BN12_2400009 [Tetrasphaera japonica T1-X7]